MNARVRAMKQEEQKQKKATWNGKDCKMRIKYGKFTTLRSQNCVYIFFFITCKQIIRHAIHVCVPCSLFRLVFSFRFSYSYRFSVLWVAGKRNKIQIHSHAFIWLLFKLLGAISTEFNPGAKHCTNEMECTSKRKPNCMWKSEKTRTGKEFFLDFTSHRSSSLLINDEQTVWNETKTKTIYIKMVI